MEITEFVSGLVRQDPDVRVVLVSGNPFDQRRLLDALPGNCTFVTKPFRASDLLAKVNS